MGRFVFQSVEGGGLVLAVVTAGFGRGWGEEEDGAGDGGEGEGAEGSLEGVGVEVGVGFFGESGGEDDGEVVFFGELCEGVEEGAGGGIGGLRGGCGRLGRGSG